MKRYCTGVIVLQELLMYRCSNLVDVSDWND